MRSLPLRWSDGICECPSNRLSYPASSAKFKFDKIAAVLQADLVCISIQRRAVVIVIAPDKRAASSRKQIKDALATHVAAMDQELSAGRAKRRDPRRRGVRVVMRVAQNTEQRWTMRCGDRRGGGFHRPECTIPTRS